VYPHNAKHVSFWPNPDGRIGAGHRRPIGNQRTCRRNKTPALPLERQRNSCPLSARVARNEPHVVLCHPPDRRRFLSALSDLHQVQKSTE
jgi:hypothetical protein